MALQIANPTVVAKIEMLAKTSGLTKKAAVEKAVDAMLTKQKNSRSGNVWDRFDAILGQIDKIPESTVPFDPLEWDEHGLPR